MLSESEVWDARSEIDTCILMFTQQVFLALNLASTQQWHFKRALAPPEKCSVLWFPSSLSPEVMIVVANKTQATYFGNTELTLKSLF